jgi:hypothetical protein
LLKAQLHDAAATHCSKGGGQVEPEVVRVNSSDVTEKASKWVNICGVPQRHSTGSGRPYNIINHRKKAAVLGHSTHKGRTRVQTCQSASPLH